METPVLPQKEESVGDSETGDSEAGSKRARNRNHSGRGGRFYGLTGGQRGGVGLRGNGQSGMLQLAGSP